ncbi:hypothetical protein [Erythrobacter litoralis]|uniref:hypothetical protein n=1 Tax=Erythrobacter litoralis TaxID=39960 RepID=UPI002434F566|nr:hypothetical protein [Erythrobacter litoralis]
MSRMNPVGGVADFWNEIRRPTPYRWPVLAASLLASGSLLFWLTQEEYFVPPAPPRVTYITTFEEGRTDEEIRQSNIENQRRKEARQAEIAAREERKRERYRMLGRATGLDVDAMEAEAEAERARAEAAEQARLDRLFPDRKTAAQTEAAPAE